MTSSIRLAPIFGQPGHSREESESGEWPNFRIMGAEWAVIAAIYAALFWKLRDSFTGIAATKQGDPAKLA